MGIESKGIDIDIDGAFNWTRYVMKTFEYKIKVTFMCGERKLFVAHRQGVASCESIDHVKDLALNDIAKDDVYAYILQCKIKSVTYFDGWSRPLSANVDSFECKEVA